MSASDPNAKDTSGQWPGFLQVAGGGGFVFYSLPLSLEVLFLQRIIYFKLVILHWVIADLQCCDRLRWTARDSAMRVHVCILPQTPLSTRLPQNIKQSSLCAVRGELCLLVIHVKQASVHLSTPK